MYLPQQAKVMIHRDNHQHCLSLLKVVPVLQIFQSVHHPGFSHRRCLCTGQECAPLEHKREASDAEKQVPLPNLQLHGSLSRHCLQQK